MNRYLPILPLLLLLLLFPSCERKVETLKEKSRYSASFLELFDTVTTIVGYEEDEEAFRAECERIRQELSYYHRLFDIYNTYEGMNNLKSINDNAGRKEVEVDRPIIELLLFSRRMCEETGGLFNPMLGSVLRLWHEAREESIRDPERAYIPPRDQIEEALRHISLDFLVISEENSTVYITDPEACLDVGAIAKGYAVEKVSENLRSGYLISVGGNVSSSGPKPSGASWVVGLQDPFGDIGSINHTVELGKGAVVTSGDYQRYYLVDGESYHHIIDPRTGYPSRYWKAVSVLSPSSAVADVLSTALFLMEQEEAEELLGRYSSSALWTKVDGGEVLSSGMKEKLRT